MLKRKRLHWTLVVLVSLAATVVGSAALFLAPAYAQGVQPPPPTSQPSLVLRIPFESRDDLRDLAARLDIWEVHQEEGYIVALAPLAERSRLEAEGRDVSVSPLSFHPNAIPGYPCYRTVDELYADLQVVHADHPDITELVDIGDSYERRDIWVLRITNRAITTTRPIFFLMANIHGRELITNEAAMVFIDYLTDNYGVDPDVTWLVDHHEVHISVSTNPDGHVKNEPGQPWAWWRKNANPDNGWCDGTDYGVDLNRNSTFMWGCCGGSSGYSCSETYRGPSAGSESETQAVEDYVRSIFPDQRDSSLDAAAPLTTTGVFITLHSYGNLVLWPWGNTSDPPPNASGLSALGQKMATYNGYTPKQAVGLYPTDGTTDDWAYGELGVAAYTFEIGGYSDGFYPSCSRYNALIRPNIPALLYAAKVARTPYLTSHGPDALNVVAGPNGMLPGVVVTVTATINDAGNGGDDVAAAELYLDTPPWGGGAPVSMSAADGAFDEVSEAAVTTLDTSGLSPGRHIVFVRGQDSEGHWGPFSAAWLRMASFTSSSPDWLGEVTVFTNTTVGTPPITYTWDFGDGASIVTDVHPTHTYTAAGVYTVVLTATDVNGTVVMSRPVTIYGSPVVGFLSSGPGWVGQTVVFTNTTLGDPPGDPAITYRWDFGDGTPANLEIHPTHVYTAPGLYTVVLTATNPAGYAIVAADVAVYAAGVVVEPATATLTGDPGAGMTYTLRVTNTGTHTDSFGVAVTGHAWTTSVAPDLTPDLKPTTGADVVVRVDVDPGALAGERDVVTVTVTSQGDGVTSADAILTTTADTVYGVAIAPVADSRNGSPGETVTYTLYVTNTGNFTNAYHLSRLGSGWPTVFWPIDPFTLGPGAWRNVGVYVTIPVSATPGERDVAVVQIPGTGVLDVSTLTTTVLHHVYLPLLVRDYR